MARKPDSRISILLRFCCFTVLALVLFFYVLYGINMNRWRESPDYGWRAMYDSGPNVVAEVFGRGWQSGLRAGDRVLAINGSVYDTFDELFFSLRNPLLGGLNTYTVTRNGHLVDITIKNGRMGFPSVLRRSGPLFAVGFLYASIGILVFFMKNFIVKNPVYLQDSEATEALQDFGDVYTAN